MVKSQLIGSIDNSASRSPSNREVDAYRDSHINPIILHKDNELQHKNGFKYYLALKSYDKNKTKNKLYQARNDQRYSVLSPGQSETSKKRVKSNFLPNLSNEKRNTKSKSVERGSQKIDINKPMKFNLERLRGSSTQMDNYNDYDLGNSAKYHSSSIHKGKPIMYHIFTEGKPKLSKKLMKILDNVGGQDSALNDDDIMFLEELNKRKQRKRKSKKREGSNMILY